MSNFEGKEGEVLEQAKYKCSGCGSKGMILVPKGKNKEVDSEGRLCLTMCLKCEPEIMFEKGYLSYIPPAKQVESKAKEVESLIKLRPYAILTTDSTRIEVKAYNVDNAYKKAREKLAEFIKKGNIATNKETDLTSAYMTFGRSGVNTTGFVTTKASIIASKKYKLVNGLLHEGDVIMDKNKSKRETLRKELDNNPILEVIDPPKVGLEGVGGSGTLKQLFNDETIDKYELKRIYEEYDLDKELPKDLEEMFYALRHCNVKYGGETVYNPIATYIEHPDTELVTSELHKITLFSGHNLVNTAVLVLYEIVNRFGCWFVINRTNSDKVEIDIWCGN